MTPTQSKVVTAIHKLGDKATPVAVARHLGMLKWTLIFHLRRMRAAGILSPVGRQGEPIRVLRSTPSGLGSVLDAVMSADGSRGDLDDYAGTMIRLRDWCERNDKDFRSLVATLAEWVMHEGRVAP